jgi:hypothetical protein
VVVSACGSEPPDEVVVVALGVRVWEATVADSRGAAGAVGVVALAALVAVPLLRAAGGRSGVGVLAARVGGEAALVALAGELGCAVVGGGVPVGCVLPVALLGAGLAGSGVAGRLSATTARSLAESGGADAATRNFPQLLALPPSCW